MEMDFLTFENIAIAMVFLAAIRGTAWEFYKELIIFYDERKARLERENNE